jgi:hypothetical protein
MEVHQRLQLGREENRSRPLIAPCTSATAYIRVGAQFIASVRRPINSHKKHKGHKIEMTKKANR